jgi:polyisoprenoid-binding protein YceI
MKPMQIGGTIFLMLISNLAAMPPAEYHVDTDKENLVTFISNAPLENIHGKTSKIDGYIIWAGENLADSSNFYFRVELGALETGIGLRDRHMRENYLETEKYPLAEYAGKLVQLTSNADSSINIKANGTFSIHGKSQPLTTDIYVTPQSNGYQVRSSFHVMLEEFDIKIPKLAFLKVAEDIQVEVNFFAKKY